MSGGSELQESQQEAVGLIKSVLGLLSLANLIVPGKSMSWRRRWNGFGRPWAITRQPIMPLLLKLIMMAL
jgi:hypothetical protein